MLQRTADVAVGHCAQLALVQAPVPARQPAEVFKSGAGTPLHPLAVAAEVEEAIQRDPEQVERLARRHLHSGDPDREAHRVTGPLGENQDLGLLSRDGHLRCSGPAYQNIGGALRSASGRLDVRSCTEGGGVVGVQGVRVKSLLDFCFVISLLHIAHSNH